MTDLRLDYDADLQGADLVIANGLLQLDAGLRTAVLISLFSDARANESDELPANDGDRRGWWGDSFSEIDGDRIGSRLWLLSRSKQTDGTLELARGYSRDALAWMLDDGIASSVDVDASWHAIGILRLDIALTPAIAGAASQRFTVFWDASYAL